MVEMPKCENCGVGIGKILDYEAHFRLCVGMSQPQYVYANSNSNIVDSVAHLGRPKWQCKSCGYIFDGALVTEPATHSCPKCYGQWLVSPPNSSFFNYTAGTNSL